MHELYLKTPIKELFGDKWLVYLSPSFLVCLTTNRTAVRKSDNLQSFHVMMSHFTLQTQSRILQWWRLDFGESAVHKRWVRRHCFSSREVTVTQSSNPNLFLKLHPFIESRKLSLALWMNKWCGRVFEYCPQQANDTIRRLRQSWPFECATSPFSVVHSSLWWTWAGEYFVGTGWVCWNQTVSCGWVFSV